jgi:hypothetical protein
LLEELSGAKHARDRPRRIGRQVDRVGLNLLRVSSRACSGSRSKPRHRARLVNGYVRGHPAQRRGARKLWDAIQQTRRSETHVGLRAAGVRA